MKFIIDAQLPPGICARLRQLGHDGEHVSEIQLMNANDAQVVDAVIAAEAILMTKDDDFLTLRHPDRYTLLWLRCGNITNRGLIEWLEPRWAGVEKLLRAGERLIELR